MNPDFEVDAESLLQDATAVTGFAGRVVGTAARVPVADPSPHWAATGAADLTADSARRLVGLLGRDVEETAERIRAAATAYREADNRAAARLRTAR
ncbi:hypothetical protein Ait01nite_064710 [Actinoplanes italicus]|uniref:Excreted virulence factor EspC (Type VII ESX diderm) n=1 Tax=Actinoplanes italicus TaxID=113567 RepID=A0A2T0KQ14_9ACTN|nr:hypothetical protein [Actinoplanes italicus]PRX25841.1 hypothetical protein CLV67_101561 [Actinoplanes italicus]GIE33426.1 hypothetical protein Ait01nite_064710 [Actinoplanes italicus]